MRKFVLICLLLVTLLLSACQRDLPPEPGGPDITGKADYAALFAEADNFEVAYDPLYFGNVIQVPQSMKAGADYIWHLGYYLSEDSSQWIPVEFNGPMVAGKWITASAKANFYYNGAQLNDGEKGVVLAYSCNKARDVWDCHGNKWMLQTFDFNYRLCEPGEYRCNGNTVEQCDNNVWELYQHCLAFEQCSYDRCIPDLPEDPTGPGDFSQETDVVKIESTNNKYNLYDTFWSARSGTYIEADLPGILNTEFFIDDVGPTQGEYEYVQTLNLAKNGVFGFNPYNDNDFEYNLKIEGSDPVYAYSLIFLQPVQFDPDYDAVELAGTVLTIQEDAYTITGVEFNAQGGVEAITLVQGDKDIWLSQDNPYNIGDHTITVIAVNNEATSCGVEVDGIVQWVDLYKTNSIGGLSVTLLGIVVTDSTSIINCNIMVGNSEIVLQNNRKVLRDGVEVEGSEVNIHSTSSYPYSLEAIYVHFTPDEDDFISVGETFKDPVFGQFGILFDSINNGFDDSESDPVIFENRGEIAELRFLSNDNVEIYVPYYINGYNIEFGSDITEPMLLSSGRHEGYYNDLRILYLDEENNYPHVLVLEPVYCNNKSEGTEEEVHIYDQTYQKMVTNGQIIKCGIGPQLIKLNGLGSISLDFQNDYVDYYGPSANTTILTRDGGKIHFTGPYGFVFEEAQGPEQPKSNIFFGFIQSEGTIKIDRFELIGESIQPDYNSDQKIWWVATRKGSIAARNDEMAVIYHTSETKANVYLKSMDETTSVVLPERCQFPAGTDCVEKATICSNGIEVTLRNNIGFSIDVGSVYFGEHCDVTSVNQVVQNNELFNLRANCDFSNLDQLNTKVSVDYVNLETGLAFAVQGEIRGLVDHSCSMVFSVEETCIDSDGGDNPNVQGKTTGIFDISTLEKGTAYDTCWKEDSSKLTEYYCGYVSQISNPVVIATSHTCPNGCSNGACIE